MHFVPPNVELNDGYFLPWKEKAQKNCNIGGQISFLWWEDELSVTLAFLLKVAELIQGLIVGNDQGFNSDLEENIAQLNADFYP